MQRKFLTGGELYHNDDARRSAMRYRTMFYTLLLIGACAFEPSEAEPVGLTVQGHTLVGVFAGIPATPLQSCGTVNCAQGKCGITAVTFCNPLKQEYVLPCANNPSCHKSRCRTDEFGSCCGLCNPYCAYDCNVACFYCSGGE